MNHYQVKNVNETESDVYIDGELAFRVSLLNRAFKDAQFSIALPGIGGNFNCNYKWVAHFPAVSRTLKSTIEAATVHSVPFNGETVVAAIMQARKRIMHDNKAVMVRSRV